MHDIPTDSEWAFVPPDVLSALSSGSVLTADRMQGEEETEEIIRGREGGGDEKVSLKEPLVREPLVRESLVREPLVRESLVRESLVREPLALGRAGTVSADVAAELASAIGATSLSVLA